MVFSIGLYRIFSEYRCHRGYECLFNEIILDKEKRKEYYYRKSKESDWRNILLTWTLILIKDLPYVNDLKILLGR